MECADNCDVTILQVAMNTDITLAIWKLAQFDFIKAQSNATPILLLDDIFDKLDESRVTQIIDLVNDDNFGQLFISDTHADRTEAIVKEIHQTYKFFKL